MSERFVAPKLIGIIKLPVPRVKRGDGFTDHVIYVAFDTDGQPWALVVRQAPIDGSKSMYRINPHRWVRFEAMPFESGELITADEWKAESGAGDE